RADRRIERRLDGDFRADAAGIPRRNGDLGQTRRYHFHLSAGLGSLSQAITRHRSINTWAKPVPWDETKLNTDARGGTFDARRIPGSGRGVAVEANQADCSLLGGRERRSARSDIFPKFFRQALAAR